MDEDNLKSAYIFPGITNIANMRSPAYDALKKWIEPYCNFVSEILAKDIGEYIMSGEYKNMQGIDAQIIGYAVSCAVYDNFIKRRGAAEYISGYSVGVFAALYAARSISFLSGVTLLYKLNKVVSDLCDKEEKFLMASVVGLEKAQLTSVIGDREDVDIVNQNSETSMIISGKKKTIRELEDDILEAGALFFKVLPIERPYHANFLTKCRDEWVNEIKLEEVKDPTTPVISPTTAKILITRKDCIGEMEDNYCSPFSWLEILKQTWNLGVREMYECGAGKDLGKIGKYSGLAHKYHHFN